MVQIKRALRLVIALIALLGSTRAHAEPTRSSADQAARAEQLFHEGTRAFEAAEYSEAYGALRSAWDLAPGYRTAAGLGQVELSLAQYRDAAEHLSYCLRHYPPDGDPVGRAHVEQGLDQAREHVAAVRIRVSVEAADIAVDGVTVGRSPLEGLVFVSPGSHVVAATRAGYVAAEETVDAPLRATRDVSLSLAATVQASESSPHDAVPFSGPSPELDHPKSRGTALSPTAWVLIVGGSLTAAALATAIVFDLKGASAGDELSRLSAQLGGRPDTCAAPSPDRLSLCSRLREAGDDRSTDNQIAMLAAIGTGALAAATAGTALLVYFSDKAPRRTALHPFMRATATAGGGGLVLGSRF